jgi:hypothetical protein
MEDILILADNARLRDIRFFTQTTDTTIIPYNLIDNKK